MDDLLPPVETPRKSWIDRIQAVVEILLLSGLISSFLAAIPLSLSHGREPDFLLKDAKALSLYLLLESGITFFILAGILKLRRETLASLGIRWKSWKQNLTIGLALVPLLFAINALVAVFFRTYFPKYYTEQNPLLQNVQTPQQLALFIFSAIVAGGIKEELQRAFILNRFRTYLGGAGVGLVIWSLAFGAGHYAQGAQGIVIASLFGFIFGTIYLLSGSLIAPIVAHGAYDSLAILAYWLVSSRAT